MTKSRTIYDRAVYNSDVNPNLVGLQPGSTPNSLGSTPYGQEQVLYVKEPGTAAMVSMSDINQGGIGDCFFLAALGEIARQSVIQDNLNFIPSMIQVNANGTETVKLYQTTGYSYVTNSLTFGQVSETVTNSFSSNGVNSGFNQSAVGNLKEIWPQVIEKAYAQLEGGYDAISNGGWPHYAMMAMTGQNAYGVSPEGLTLSKLLSWANNNDLIDFDTNYSGNLPYGLINDHSYMFEGFLGSGANTMVKLGNPWGFDQPSPVPLSQIAGMTSGIDEIAVGHFNFGAGHPVTPSML